MHNLCNKLLIAEQTSEKSLEVHSEWNFAKSKFAETINASFHNQMLGESFAEYCEEKTSPAAVVITHIKKLYFVAVTKVK